MPSKPHRSIRVTFRLTPEENDALRVLAERKGYGSVSAVVRELLRCRLAVVRELLEAEMLKPSDIGAEIRQMFGNYEDDGRDIAFPSDVNRRL